MFSDFYKKEKILKIILVIIGVILIAFIFLMIFYANWEIDNINNLEKEFSSLNLNKEELKQEEEKKIILPKITYSLAGEIKEINSKENYLFFEASIPELGNGDKIIYRKEMRKVFVTPETKINKLVFLSGENNKKTIQEFPLSFKDLKPKNYIEVISNQDISTLEEFLAIQIRIQP